MNEKEEIYILKYDTLSEDELQEFGTFHILLFKTPFSLVCIEKFSYTIKHDIHLRLCINLPT